MVPCACCGRGQVALSEKLFETYSVIRERGPVTVLEIHDELSRRPKAPKLLRTAISNRVNMLKAHKLILGHRKGRSWVYVPAKMA